MKASPQARINRRVLFLSVAVAGAAAVAYRAARPKSGGLPLSPSAANSTGTAATEGRLDLEERLEIRPRPDLPSSVLQPYPSQPRPGEASTALPRHGVNAYALRESDPSLKLQLLPPDSSGEPWSAELSSQGGIVWQQQRNVAGAAGLVELELPAQRMKSGRYALTLARPGSRRYLYLFEIDVQ